MNRQFLTQDVLGAVGIHEHEIMAWGLDGWDAGDWPYVRYYLKELDGDWVAAQYVEGDVYHVKGSWAQAVAWINSHVHWWWHRSGRGPESPDLSNPDHCGPFSWQRLDAGQPPRHQTEHPHD